MKDPRAYSEKVRDPRWQRRRLEVLQRDGWMCRNCGATTKTLEVHHLMYWSRLEMWDVDSVFLETLCTDCHWDKTSKKTEHSLAMDAHDLIAAVVRKEGPAGVRRMLEAITLGCVVVRTHPSESVPDPAAAFRAAVEERHSQLGAVLDDALLRVCGKSIRIEFDPPAELIERRLREPFFTKVLCEAALAVLGPGAKIGGPWLENRL